MRTVAVRRSGPLDDDPSRYPEWHDETAWYVYYLWDDDEIIYIGKTNSLHNRMPQHASKSYDRVTYRRLPDEPGMLRFERDEIRRWQPVLNKHHKKLTKYARMTHR